MLQENHEEKDMKTTRIVSNADNEGLMPSSGNRIIIGYVYEANGAGSKEMPEYVPTRHELTELLKYWARRVIDISWFEFVYSATGSYELRLKPFAYSRMERICELLDDGEGDEIVRETFEKFGKELDKEAWDIFMNGTEEQWEEFQDKQAELRGEYV